MSIGHLNFFSEEGRRTSSTKHKDFGGTAIVTLPTYKIMSSKLQIAIVNLVADLK